jgi:hypothetical protein
VQSHELFKSGRKTQKDRSESCGREDKKKIKSLRTQLTIADSEIKKGGPEPRNLGLLQRMVSAHAAQAAGKRRPSILSLRAEFCLESE